MTLRARLAVAFFVVLLGPVLLGAVLVASVLVTAGSPEARLNQANVGVRMAVAARCQHLAATAHGLALDTAVRGDPFAVKPADAPSPWVLCGVGPSSVPLPPGTRYGGLAARAEVRGPGGSLIGYAYAVQPLDPAFLDQLSAAAGTRLTLLDEGGEAGARLEAGASQPLPLALSSSPAPPPGEGFPVLIAVGLVAGLIAAVLGWWLAGLATRPLGVLLGAVDRVAAGDLTARPRVGGRDEAGLLSHGIDRLIGEMQESQRLSVTDALTGLGNVRHLADSLRREVERASRFGRALGVLVLDLDRFKTVNDTYGHRAGDSVLVEFALRVRGVIREVDLAFRQGGEEFVILLPETDVPGSLTAARRIGEAVRERPFTIGHRRGVVDHVAPEVIAPITVSIGVAVFPRHALTGTEVLDAADEALYAAKAAGRDTFVLASVVVPEQRSRASGGTTSPATMAAG